MGSCGTPGRRRPGDLLPEPARDVQRRLAGRDLGLNHRRSARRPGRKPAGPQPAGAQTGQAAAGRLSANSAAT